MTLVAAGLVAVSPGGVEPAAAATLASISGTVSADGKSGGVPGVYVSLHSPDGLLSRTTTTNGYGQYAFNSLNSYYTYEIEFIPPQALAQSEGYTYQF